MKQSLYIKLKNHHISILHDIVFSLKPKKSFFSGSTSRSGFKELITTHNFCFYKSLSKISMDCSGCLRCSTTHRHSPCSCFFFTSRKIIHKSHRSKCQMYQIIQSRDVCSLGLFYQTCNIFLSFF